MKHTETITQVLALVSFGQKSCRNFPNTFSGLLGVACRPCRRHSLLALPFLDLTFKVPFGFFQVLNGVFLQVTAPDIFDCITQVKAHVFSNLDALNT